MESDKKRTESERLVHAYRSWASQIEASNPGSSHKIFMDDLSSLAAVSSIDNSPPSDCMSVFQEALQMPDIFSEPDLLKIRQSLAFAKFMDAVPTREAVVACGGRFESATSTMTDIEEITRQIEELEKSKLVDFPSTSDTSYDYAVKIAEYGWNYFKSKRDDFKPLDFQIRKLNPSSHFTAQVVTNADGNIFCEIPFDKPVNAGFAGLLIHEILGHVFHFTQLKSSDIPKSTPHLLCLSIHTHEGFFIEAIAQLVTTYISSTHALNLPGKEQIALHDLKHQRTQALAHYLITLLIDGELDLTEAIKIHFEHSNGSMSMEFLKERYTAITRNLFAVRTGLNYYSSFKAVKPLLKLGDDQFFSVLKEMVNGYFTPESLELFVLSHSK